MLWALCVRKYQDIAFDGINLVTALGGYTTYSRQKLKPMKNALPA